MDATTPLPNPLALPPPKEKIQPLFSGNRLPLYHLPFLKNFELYLSWSVRVQHSILSIWLWLPSTKNEAPSSISTIFQPALSKFIQKFVIPPPSKKGSRDYAFYMRYYKKETIKLLSFYIKNIIFLEL